MEIEDHPYNGQEQIETVTVCPSCGMLSMSPGTRCTVCGSLETFQQAWPPLIEIPDGALPVPRRRGTVLAGMGIGFSTFLLSFVLVVCLQSIVIWASSPIAVCLLYFGILVPTQLTIARLFIKYIDHCGDMLSGLYLSLSISWPFLIGGLVNAYT